MKLFLLNKFFTVVFLGTVIVLAFKVSPVLASVAIVANLLEVYTEWLLQKRMWKNMQLVQQTLLDLDNYDTSTPPKEGNC